MKAFSRSTTRVARIRCGTGGKGRPLSLVLRSVDCAAWAVSIERHWISLRTNTENRFVILRVDDAQVRSVLSALEERTGRAPQAVGQRKRTR